jgi:hypothetical protein
VDLRPGRISTIAVTSAVVIVLLGRDGGGRAYAQSAEAEVLFNDGNKLMASGKLAQACDAFEASNRAEPRAGTLLRLGECREQNRQLASAWSAYKDAVNRAKDPRKRDFATAKATAIAARMSYLTVTVPEDSGIKGMVLTRNGKPFDPALWNRALPVDGGDYLLVSHAPGYEDWQTTKHVPVDGAKVSVEVPKPKELPKPNQLEHKPIPPSPTVPTPPPVTQDQLDEARPSAATFTTRRKLAIGVAGASAIGVVAAVLLGEAANGKQNDAYKLCSGTATPCTQADQSNALIKAAQSRALEANVAFGFAAAAAIGAGVLWFTGGPGAEDPRRVRVASHVAPGELSVLVLGRF